MLNAEKRVLQRLIAIFRQLRVPLTLSTVEEMSPKDIAQVLAATKQRSVTDIPARQNSAREAHDLQEYNTEN